MWQIIHRIPPCNFSFLTDSSKHAESDSDDSEEIQNALNEISPVFQDENEESHLDLTLEEEASFLSEYRTMIVTRTQMEKQL